MTVQPLSGELLESMLHTALSSEQERPGNASIMRLNVEGKRP
jgi:hypothetical protein